MNIDCCIDRFSWRFWLFICMMRLRVVLFQLLILLLPKKFSTIFPFNLRSFKGLNQWISGYCWFAVDNQNYNLFHTMSYSLWFIVSRLSRNSLTARLDLQGCCSSSLSHFSHKSRERSTVIAQNQQKKQSNTMNNLLKFLDFTLKIQLFNLLLGIYIFALELLDVLYVFRHGIQLILDVCWFLYGLLYLLSVLDIFYDKSKRTNAALQYLEIRNYVHIWMLILRCMLIKLRMYLNIQCYLLHSV